MESSPVEAGRLDTGAADPAPEGDGTASFRCPRCDREVTAAFYGPCDQCRATLRATVHADARDVDAAEYEPKMNVTPNAVATKD